MHMPPSFFAPVHKEGYVFVAAGVGASLLGFLFYAPLGWLFSVLALWCAYFFRNPDRVPPEDKTALVSPADGIILAIDDKTPPRELGGQEKPARQRISVFMSVLDGHINRAPYAGVIGQIVYVPGSFFNASLVKESEANERQIVRIETDAGQSLIVVQIAGLVARRIVAWKREGDRLATGERFGMIRFGSRVDVYLPEGASVSARVGQTAIAGETIIAHLPARDKKTAMPRTRKTNTPKTPDKDKDEKENTTAQNTSAAQGEQNRSKAKYRRDEV